MRNMIMQCLLSLSLVTLAVAAEKPVGVKEYASVGDLASEISSYFPKVEGVVKSVEGDRLTISLGTKDGLRKGVLLTVWREGKEIIHPVTNAVIGRLEDEVGAFEVTVTGETTSIGVMKKISLAPNSGDKVRITPKKIRIALLPLRAEHPEIIQELAERLKENSRFALLDSEKGEAFLADGKQRDATLIKELGRAFNLELVVTIEIAPSDNKYLTTVGIFYADDARRLDTIVAMLDLRTKRDALGEVKPFFAPERGGKDNFEGIPIDVRLFAAADLEGNGSLQYVFSDGARLHVFKQTSSGWREEWAEINTYSFGEMRHFNIDVLDVNGNGRPEIFVTGMLNGSVVSYVVEFNDGVYRRIADVPGFLRVATMARKGSALIGQKYDPVTFYSGQPIHYVWREGRYTSDSEFPLPRGVDLYAFSYASAGEDGDLLVALDDKDRMLVYSNGVMVWKSEEKYTSMGTTVTKPLTGIDAALSRSSPETMKIRERISALDLNGDGREEILLPRTGGSMYKKGHMVSEFVGLGWTGDRLEQRWNIQDIPGVVLDYRLIRRQGMGAQILALVMVPGGLSAADSLRVMTFSTK